MFQLLKRLLGNRDDDPSVSGASDLDSTPESDAKIDSYRATDFYFFKSHGMQYAISISDFERAGTLARECLQYVPGFVSETRNTYGTFGIRSIPPLEQGGRILALVDDEEGLSQLEGVVNAIPELEPWRVKIPEHWEDLRLFNLIKSTVLSHPYCLQTDINSLVGHDNGRRIATLISYLEKSRNIQRIPEGKTYQLVSLDSVYGPPWAPLVPEESETQVATNAEIVLAADRWSTAAEIAKGRISAEEGGCWTWTSTLSSGGYGRVTRTIKGRKYNVPVHQLTWLEANDGVWPLGAVARHVCRNRACCRPDHIIPGTPLENVQDAQFRDGTMPVSIHRLPPDLQQRLIRDGSVEWDGKVYDLE